MTKDLVRQRDESRALYRRGMMLLGGVSVLLGSCAVVALLVPGAAMVAVTVAILGVVAGMPAGLAMYETGRETYRRAMRQLGEGERKQLPAARVLRHH